FNFNYYETSSKKYSNLLGVVFTQKLDEFPIIDSRISSGEIEVLIGTSKKVQKITYQFRPLASDEQGIYPTISAQEALNEMGQRNAELIVPSEESIPSNVEINTFLVAYRLTSTGIFLQP